MFQNEISEQDLQWFFCHLRVQQRLEYNSAKITEIYTFFWETWRASLFYKQKGEA